MTLTLDLSPELQAQLREEAAHVGMNENAFILDTLKARLGQKTPRAKTPTALSKEETELLLKINEGLPQETWAEYRSLVAKRRAETLTSDEHVRLIALTNEREIAHARRIESLVKLAQLRGTTLDAVMGQLGIHPPGYE